MNLRKKFFVLTGLVLLQTLTPETAFSANSSQIQQTNLLCSPLDELSSFRLILKNGAVGPISSFELQVFDQGDWNVIADRAVRRSTGTAPQGGHNYIGRGVKLTHVLNSHQANPTRQSTASLEVSFDGHKLRSEFKCSVVE